MHPVLSKQLNEILDSGLPINVIPGLGGHSGASWAPVFNSANNSIYVLIFNAFDDGGDTGKVTAALGTPAMGDLRNTIMHIWKDSKESEIVALSKLFTIRVDTFDKLREHTKAAFEIFNIISEDDSWYKDLDIDKFLDEYETKFNLLDSEYTLDNGKLIEHNVGNIVLASMVMHLGSMYAVIEKYKEIGLLNKNIYFILMSDNAVELTGVDEYSNFVRKERNIDQWKYRIPLKSLKCVIPKSTPVIEFSEKNEFISTILEKATTITIPASSPNNWVPLVNLYCNEIFHAVNRSEPANLICWTPITKEVNTYGLADIIFYLYEKFGNKINFIIPESPDDLIIEHFEEFKKIVAAYEKEGKDLQFYNLLEIHKNLNKIHELLYANVTMTSKEYKELLNNIIPASGCIDMIYFHPESETTLEVPLTRGQNQLHAKLTQINRGIKHSARFISRFMNLLLERKTVLQDMVYEIELEVDEEFKKLVNGDTNGLDKIFSTDN